MRKNRKRIIITALEILAVLLLLAPAYRLACGQRVFSKNFFLLLPDNDRLSNKGNSDWQTSCFVANRPEGNFDSSVRLDEKFYRTTKTGTFATQSFLGFIARSTSSL